MSAEKIYKLTEEEKIKIKQLLKYSDKEIDNFIDILNEWVKKQPHLPDKEDETRLKMMLYLNKFSLEKTKKNWDLYYSIKHIAPEYYIDKEPLNPDMYNLVENMIMTPIPNISDDLCRIYLIKYPKNSSEFNALKYMQLFVNICELRMIYDPCLYVRIVLDVENLSLPMMVQITPVLAKKTYDVVKNVYTDIFKGLHFVNVNSITEKFVGLINSILPQKMGKRVFCHKNYEDIVKTLGPRCLPNECGGTAGPIDQIYDEFKLFYRSKNDWLKDLANKKSDESKRIGEPLDTGMFGMTGSFRQLNVD